MNPAHVITHRRRLLLSAAIVAAAAATATISGCSSLAGRQPANAHPQAPLIPDAPAMGTEPVAKGVYFAIDRSKPLSGEALARALLLPDAALAAIRHRVDSAAAQTQLRPRNPKRAQPNRRPNSHANGRHAFKRRIPTPRRQILSPWPRAFPRR